MPKIPRYDQRISTPSARVESVRPSSNGAEIAQMGDAVIGVARGMQQRQANIARAEALQAKQEEERRREEERLQAERDNAWADGLLPEASLQVSRQLGTLQGSLPETGEGYTDSVLKTIDEVYAPLEQAATTPVARQRVLKDKASAREKFGAQAADFERKQYEAWIGGQIDRGANASREAVRTAPINTLDAVVEQEVARYGTAVGVSMLDPDERVKRQGDFARELADLAYERIVVANAEQTGKVVPVSGGFADRGSMESWLKQNFKGRLGSGYRPQEEQDGLVAGGFTRARRSTHTYGLGQDVIPDAPFSEWENIAAELRATGLFEKVIVESGRGRNQGTGAHIHLEGKRGGAIAALASSEGRQKAEAKAEKAVEERNQGLVNRLDIAIDAGQAGDAEIEQFVQAGVLDPSSDKYASLKKAAAKKAEEAAEKAARAARVDAAMRLGTPLDPKDKDDQKALDERFVQLAGAWSPEETLGNAVAFSRQVGSVPQTLQASVRAGLRSSNPQQVQFSTEVINRLRRANPTLLQDFTAEELSLANTITTYMQSGMLPADASRAAGEISRMTPQDRENRSSAYVRAVAEEGKGATRKFIDNYVQDRFSDWRFWRKTPQADALMETEFTRLAQNEYIRNGGNMDGARKTAADLLFRVWGVSRIGGEPRLMRWAPETAYRVYGDDRDTKWITKQVVDEVFANAVYETNGPVEDNIRLIPHPERPTDAQGRPVYAVMFRDKNGVERPVLRDGKVIRYQPKFKRAAKPLPDGAERILGIF